ncbi:MAG: PAS domain S-box protein [Chloroflexi bacterium]|nr:PAS domain S-box protein [Chloroflexota bacterium]
MLLGEDMVVYLRRRGDILETLAEGSDGVYAVDLNQRIVVWNRHAEEMLGWPASEVLGKRCYEVMGGMQEERAACAANCFAILMARQSKVAPSQTVLATTRAGQPRWMSITHVLLPAEPRELSSLVHIFRDATEEEEAKRTVQRLASFLKNTPPLDPPPMQPLSPKAKPPAALSGRERQVLGLLARGESTGVIAERLVLSPTTVRNHIQHILAKLNAHTRLEAVTSAFRSGLL